MTLEQLQKDMIAAMKAKDELKKRVLSSAINAIKNAAIAKKCKDNITEDLVNEVLLKEKKTIQEMIDTCPDTFERHDTYIEYVNMLNIIDAYAPKLETNPVIIELDIKMQLAAAGIEPVKSNRAAIMKTIMPHFKGKADMKVVNQVIGEILQ